MKYLIKANNLFESGYIEKVDRQGKLYKDKVITNSVYLGYYENDEYIVIRAFKRAYKCQYKNVQLGMRMISWTLLI